MKRKISQVAIMAFLLSSLAFAGDKPKSTSTSGDAETAASGDNGTASQNPCVSSGDQKDSNKKKDKNKVKPAPTDQEEQFNQVLMGIYG